MNPIQLLIAVLSDHGMLSETELAILAKSFPNVMVGVKMGASLRFALPAADITRANASEWVKI